MSSIPSRGHIAQAIARLKSMRMGLELAAHQKSHRARLFRQLRNIVRPIGLMQPRGLFSTRKGARLDQVHRRSTAFGRSFGPVSMFVESPRSLALRALLAGPRIQLCLHRARDAAEAPLDHARHLADIRNGVAALVEDAC